MNIDTKLDNNVYAESEKYRLSMQDISLEITSNHPDHLPESYFSPNPNDAFYFSNKDAKDYQKQARRLYEHTLISEIIQYPAIQRFLKNHHSFDKSKQRVCFFFDYGTIKDYQEKVWFSNEAEPIVCHINMQVLSDIAILEEISYLNGNYLYNFVCYAGIDHRRVFAKRNLLEQFFSQNNNKNSVYDLLDFAENTDTIEAFRMSDQVMSQFAEKYWVACDDKEILRANFDVKVKEICSERGWDLPIDMDKEFLKTCIFMDMFGKIGQSVYYSIFQKKQFPCCILLYAFIYEILGCDMKHKDKAYQLHNTEYFGRYYIKTTKDVLEYSSFLDEIHDVGNESKLEILDKVRGVADELKQLGHLISGIAEESNDTDRLYSEGVSLSDWADVIAFTTHGKGTKGLSKIIGRDKIPLICYDTMNVDVCAMSEDSFDQSELNDLMCDEVGGSIFTSGYILIIGRKYALSIIG